MLDKIVRTALIIAATATFVGIFENPSEQNQLSTQFKSALVDRLVRDDHGTLLSELAVFAKTKADSELLEELDRMRRLERNRAGSGTSPKRHTLERRCVPCTGRQFL